jgi:hypothetical protein
MSGFKSDCRFGTGEKRWMGVCGGEAEFEAPKRVYLMKISKKLNYILTCTFSDANAKPNFVLFRTSVLKIQHSPKLPAFKWQHPRMQL